MTPTARLPTMLFALLLLTTASGNPDGERKARIWSLLGGLRGISHARKLRMAKYFAFVDIRASRRKLLRGDVSERINGGHPSDSNWGDGLSKPFSNAKEGGGDEALTKEYWEPRRAEDMETTDDCDKSTGGFLKLCVHVENLKLNKKTREICHAQIASLASGCVFGPVE